MSQVHRSTLRSAAITFRLSEENKAALLDEARGLGISLQALLDRRVLGIENARDLRPGPTVNNDQELPLTG